MVEYLAAKRLDDEDVLQAWCQLLEEWMDTWFVFTKNH
jgi:hypothetical protein